MIVRLWGVWSISLILVISLFLTSCGDGSLTPNNNNQLTSTQTPNTVSMTANYEGFLEIADCNQISGWVWNRNQPNDSIRVDIYNRKQILTTIGADQFRQDRSVLAESLLCEICSFFR